MKLKSKREQAGLTQKEVAAIFGISRTAVAMWESGAAYPRSNKLPILADLLGCSIDELLSPEVSAPLRR